MWNPESKNGFATFEILIAMAIIVMVISVVLPLVAGGQSILVSTTINQEAIYKAKDTLENARALSISDFSSVKTSSPVNEDIYVKNMTVIDIDPFTKQITSNVSWQESGRSLSVQLTTLLTNPELGSDTCSQTLTGDWTNPLLLGTADIGQNNSGTDVDVISGRAYLTADSSAASKGDFYIFDVSNPSLTDIPILNGSIGLNTGPGLSAVHVAGNYAYVANTSTVSQLQVIDISSPSTPFLVNYIDLTASGDTAVGKSIYYANKKIYLGLTKSSGREFYVIDVSNPLAPVVKASFEVNSSVNSIIVRSDIAYLAVPNNPSTEFVSEQLILLDVGQADFGAINKLGDFSKNPSTMSGQGIYLSKDGNTLYLGQGGANPANHPNFFLLNAQNPSSVSQIDSKNLGSPSDITVSSVLVRSNLLFITTSDPSLSFQVWDLNNFSATNPYGSNNIQQTSTGGMDCEGNYIYISQKSSKAIQIIGPKK